MFCSDSNTVVEAVMESSKIVIKARFGEDIRRIAIDQNALESFKDLTKIMKKLFKTTSSLNIGYYDEENDLINIRSNLDLQTAVRASKDNVLRIVVEAVEEQGVRSFRSSMMDSSSPSRTDLLFSDMEFTLKLEQFITQTVCSKPFIDTLAEKLLPHILNPQPTPVKTNTEFDLSYLLMQSLPELDNNNIPIPVDPITTEATEDSEEENEPEDHVETPQLERHAEPESIPSVVETTTTTTTVESVVQEPVQQEPKEEEPESFVMVNPSASSKPKLPISLRSLLNLFKLSSGKRREANDDEEEEIQIDNLEETLIQLKEMGFTDRDTVVKTLKFHKRFQEGLNEVIEDLLLQHEEEENASEPTEVTE